MVRALMELQLRSSGNSPHRRNILAHGVEVSNESCSIAIAWNRMRKHIPSTILCCDTRIPVLILIILPLSSSMVCCDSISYLVQLHFPASGLVPSSSYRPPSSHISAYQLLHPSSCIGGVFSPAWCCSTPYSSLHALLSQSHVDELRLLLGSRSLPYVLRSFVASIRQREAHCGQMSRSPKAQSMAVKP